MEEDIQKAINKAAQAVLRCTKKLYDWGQRDLSAANRITFFHKIAKDIEIVRVVLLLTGSIQGLKNQVSDYLQTFIQYDWLWKEDKDAAYKSFIKQKPALDDYRVELKRFVVVENEIKSIPGNTRQRKKGGKLVSVETISLNDVIKKYFNDICPSYISIDTEGSEYEILKAFDLNKYRPKLFTVEHNFTENERKIDEHLITNGYVRIFRKLTTFDAWYIPFENL